MLSNLHNVDEFREQSLGPVHHMELAANPAIREPASISDEERQRVAEAGRRRCRESGYFEVDRVREVLRRLVDLVREA